MRIVMLAYGTWGDVRPYVVLAQALQREGYETLVLGAEEYRDWVETRGLPFRGLPLNVQEVLDSMMNTSDDEDTGTSFIASARKYSKTVAWAMQVLGESVLDIVREGDTLLYVETGQSLLHGIIEKYHLRPIIVSMFPTIPTAKFPVFNLPDSPRWMPARGLYNRVSGGVLRLATWQIVGRQGNKIRTEHLQLARIGWRKHRSLLRDTPQIMLVSWHVLPPPPDWSANVHVTGYVFDDDPEWQAPQDLLDFLSAGEKPVYLGFGSMIVKNKEQTTRLLIDAVQRSDKRAILLSGGAAIGDVTLPDTIFRLNYAPHSWLFPRMSAVVHHGGAGTMAAGLRAGVPTIVVPILGDQVFWGRRVHELGVGAQAIPHNKLTADKLANAIHEVTSNQQMQERATELGRLIQSEDGVDSAVKTIITLLSDSM